MDKKINIPKVFFGFLLASFFMWLLINLSKEYTTTISYEVAYVKLAQNKILQEDPVKEINLKVKGSGFKLISANFSRRRLKLFADKLKYASKGHYYFIPENQETSIQEQLYSGLMLEKVLQDTIHLKLGSLQSKKVPVVADVNINYQLGYDLATPITMIPESITISGPELQLAKINSVTTEKLELQDLSKNTEKELLIKLPSDIEKVNISDKVVKVKIEVDKFTEGEFFVPFEVENVPYGTTINTFPKNVKVIFKVGLNNFNKISPSSFKVVCDYRTSKESELSYLLPILKTKPDLVSSVRIVPDKIDFLTHN
ncbi:YbbR-like protein [Tenacibaculum adriaticum]|uniref:YbbR-like protein n=1 Tax=Tenacibaculum adriaticum TaxID=413713 RepID=A0A5S5DQR2_9FLAO|nr:YbbR-like domain-containing protein [Tenacibaculum adriaticum]TYP98300.1 YbbR-like protein [Tenacibaculum adriaticum]